MITKFFMVLLFLATSLFAQEASQEQLNSIYREALLFVAIFGVMGIVSYIYSTKHAKEYIPKEPTQEEILAKTLKEDRILKLKKLFADGILQENELATLLVYYEEQ
jgi:hypothetical protein